MIYNLGLYKKYVSKIEALSVKDSYTKDRLISSDFLIEKSTGKYGSLKIYYIPFEYINKNAKVTLIRITPGWTQMEIAYRQMGQDKKQGLPLEKIFQNIDKQASFAGTMRTNLVNMLDDIGLHDALNINSCALLFAKKHHLAHTTSAIRYPVFVNDKNYTGHTPNIVKDPILQKYLKKDLVKELQLVDKALVIPLGKSVSEALEYLVNQDLLNPDRCLFNFPHPSGANGHRIKQFETMRLPLKRKVKKWFN